jgi:hypothetical protein
MRTGRDVLRFENNAEIRYSERGTRLLELKAAVGALESITAEVKAIVRAIEPATIGRAS